MKRGLHPDLERTRVQAILLRWYPALTQEELDADYDELVKAFSSVPATPREKRLAYQRAWSKDHRRRERDERAFAQEHRPTRQEKADAAETAALLARMVQQKRGLIRMK